PARRPSGAQTGSDLSYRRISLRADQVALLHKGEPSLLPHMLGEPVGKRAHLLPGLEHAVPGCGAGHPGFRREAPPGVDLGPAYQLEAWVVRRIVAGRLLERVATHVDSVSSHPLDEFGQLLARRTGNALSVSPQPPIVRVVRAGAHEEMMGVEV